MGGKLTPTLHVRDVVAWRRWLRTHHDSERLVWLVFSKARTGRPCIAYEDALDEALCWGWIDGIARRIDDDTYARRFTRRTDSGKWSAANIERLRRLLSSGRMQPSGHAVISRDVLRRASTSVPARQPAKTPLSMPEELVRALDAHPAARAFFESLAPSCRRNYQLWVSSAKQPATRARRADEAARLLAQGKKTLLK